MARKATNTAPASLSFEIAEEGAPKTEGRGRPEAPILSLDAVTWARDNGKTIKFNLPNETFADVKSMTNDVRRAGKRLDCGVHVKASDDESTLWVWTGKKKTVTVTVAMVREWARNTQEVAVWAADEGINLVDGKLDPRVKVLYKQAHAE